MKYLVPITALLITMGITTYPLVWGDDKYNWGETRKTFKRVSTTSLTAYKEECSSCHLVYPPELLPARSWKKMMLGLDNHFGDNAELDTESGKVITGYLMTNSADNAKYRVSHKFNRSIKQNNSPLRITDVPYFKHEHDEIPNRLVAGNSKVMSFSQCQACHKNAEDGSFDEHDVSIPGFGQWDD